ncbi:hypothetical protein EfmAA242_06310 [Enterococcus faecium]|nr:hypothetical protein EfmAA242_06310 [Enterococcus faecium]
MVSATSCFFQRKTEEGLYDYVTYFLNGLQKMRILQFLEMKTNIDQFKKAFEIKELPEITMHNWLKGEES